MEYFAPVHQFEIRYSKLLNFASIAQETLAPFIPLSNDIQLEQDLYTGNPKYTLIYDNYTIGIQYDRVFIKFEGEIDSLLESGSIIQDPFFALYKRLTEQSTFGSPRALLLFTIYVKPVEQSQSGDTISSLTLDFAKKYVKTEETQKFIDKIEDISLTLESKTENEKINMQFGPYKGIADLNKRNFLIGTQEMIDQCLTTGQMCIVTVTDLHAKSKGLNFNSYKTLHKISKDQIWKLWN